MEEEVVVETINALYKGAGVELTFRGQVNEKVAQIFGEMLVESLRCTRQLNWVPRPTGRKATIRWIASNFSRSIRDRMRDSHSLTCARTVILKFRTRMELASQGF